jgi:GNAT superfamily N-acetyltransferase
VTPAVTVRRAGSDADLATFVRLINAATPEWPTSLEEVRWADEQYPGGARFIASLDGRDAGAATTGRIWMHGPDFERYWLTMGVAEDARRHGLGDALYRAASEVARRDGKTGFQGDLLESRPDSLAFFEHRGFAVYERMAAVRLRVDILTPPAVDPPAGIAITSLALRPDALPGVHAVAVAAFPDIPHVGEPIDAGTLEAFTIRDVERPGIPRDAFMVALDETSGTVVGYASLLYEPGSTTTAYHDMTAVLPAFRGRGIAAALKRATIRWAVEHGLGWLETGNDEDNRAMRAVNARLGYQPTPVMLGIRGPLADPSGGAGGGSAAP